MILKTLKSTNNTKHYKPQRLTFHYHHYQQQQQLHYGDKSYSLFMRKY